MANRLEIWSRLTLWLAPLFHLLAFGLMLRQQEPFYSVFYSLAWWSYIAFISAWNHRTSSNSLLFDRPRDFLWAFLASTPVWLLFEVFNFRLQNWHYIGVPPEMWIRLPGYFLAFGTVLPGVVETATLLRNLGLRLKPRRRFRLSEASRFRWAALGIVLLGLSLGWPKLFFPLVWVGPVLSLDYLLGRTVGGAASIGSALRRGDIDLIVRLPLAGLLCGFLWEFWNFWAGSKWIYTIPYFDFFKVFEMPVLGFLGFAPFALECWLFYQLALVLRQRLPSAGLGARISLVAISLVYCLLVFQGIERWTVHEYRSFIASAKATASPNIVFLYIDDLGWRDAGFMGSTYYRTPHLDRLASESVVFTNAYANAPNCAPSRASLLTGQYPPRHGIYTVDSPARGESRLRRLIPAPNKTDLELGIVTLAEALKAKGYATAHIGKWHLGRLGHLPTDQGFDVNIAGNRRGSPPGYFFPYQRGNYTLTDLRQGGSEGEYLTDRLTDEALRFIDSHSEVPFFLYLSHYAVHTPLQAKESLVARYRKKPGDEAHNNPIYAAMIESVDESVARVLGRLDSLGLRENTVVVFFSDNGGYGPATSMAPLRGSKGMLYEGGIRVPLVIRAPGVQSGSRRDTTPVIGTDLYPTILELAGEQAPPTQPLDGVSLVPLLRGDGPLEDRALFWHFPAYLEAYRGMSVPWRTTPAAAVRQGAYKLIEFFESGRLELYDLEADIGEQNDLAEAMPREVEKLYKRMKAWRQTVNAPVPRELNPDYDPEAIPER